MDGPYAGATIIHQRRPTPWWWLLVIALVFVPWAPNGHWLITAAAWLVIAALLAARFWRHRRGDAPRNIGV